MFFLPAKQTVGSRLGDSTHFRGLSTTQVYERSLTQGTYEDTCLGWRR